MILGTHDRWFIDDLRPLMPFCAIDPDARLNDVFRTRSFYSTEELLTSAALFPVERICFASARLRLGAKKLRHFATDCVIYLARLADEKILNILQFPECISSICKGIEAPSRANIRAMRLESFCAFGRAHDLHRELADPCRRLYICNLAGTLKFVSGAAWPLGSPSWHSATMTPRWVTREYARCQAYDAARTMAERALVAESFSNSGADALREEVVTWAALFAEHYCDWRRAGYSMVEACDQADYMCGSFFYNDAELLQDIPDEHIETAKSIFRAAQNAAVRTHEATYESTLHAVYETFASRMNEYVFNNPEPWKLE